GCFKRRLLVMSFRISFVIRLSSFVKSTQFGSPMISSPTVSTREIPFHYDLATVFYRLLWGRHIHHGLWEAQEPAWAAAQRLTDTLACEIGRASCRERV